MWKFTTLLVILSLLEPGCKREERSVRVGPPTGEATSKHQLSSLQAGGVSPLPPVKNPYEENALALSQGKQLFQSFNCNGCHANGGGNIGPPLMDSDWIYGSEPENIYSDIVEGRPNGMPSFRGKINEDQVWRIAAYVRSLSGQAAKNAESGRNDDIKGPTPPSSMEKQTPKQASIPKSTEMPQ
jgi:cytochrome c oxidase cbb3-type subunit 3